MDIRRAREKDIGEFIKIYKSAYKRIGKYSYKKEKMIKWYYRWLLRRDENGVFIAEVNGKAVGFIACDANWQSFFDEKVGEIHEVAVMEEYKNRGIGKKLMEEAEKYLKEKGHKTIELWVGEENPAKRFYEKLGYEAKDKFGEWIRMVKYLR
ncbi:MAG: GNAT family N-acetyltransferase [Thermoplasmata archaeon]|nr:MAG: GNAT family N-acetyltransferase [Thermoplasmata archaeon]